MYLWINVCVYCLLHVVVDLALLLFLGVMCLGSSAKSHVADVIAKYVIRACSLEHNVALLCRVI